ncbi:alternative ribosome rescue aminoacyl-tRNA hydrolase ArfB [Flavobacteriales bacterium]|jgi:ribosome-associated protein|nr:alternative ribosome rescue aminoacyl-tRNA hydrolase ArfB [Flavobacteriales bacterium]
MNKDLILKEFFFKAIRSSGAGGQHVNKVSSKVVLSFNITNSEGLNTREKRLLRKALASRLTSSETLIIACDDSKSQIQNKNKIITRFFDIITKGLIVPKKRIATKPTKGSVKRTKDSKQKRSQVKSMRKKPKLE